MQYKINQQVNYAGESYKVIQPGEKVLHLQSLRDKNLIIHCSVTSTYLNRPDDVIPAEAGIHSENLSQTTIQKGTI